MSAAPGTVLSVICCSYLQAFHLQSGPSHRNNDDPVLSLSLSYSQFSSVLIIVPELQELQRYQNMGGEGRGRGARRDKKRGSGRKKVSIRRREEKRNLRGGRRERLTKYKAGWIDMFTFRNRTTEKVKPLYLL